MKLAFQARTTPLQGRLSRGALSGQGNSVICNRLSCCPEFFPNMGFFLLFLFIPLADYFVLHNRYYYYILNIINLIIIISMLTIPASASAKASPNLALASCTSAVS